MHYCCITCCLFTISGSAFSGSDAPSLDIISLVRAVTLFRIHLKIKRPSPPNAAPRPPAWRSPILPRTLPLLLRALQVSFVTHSAPSGTFPPPSGTHLSSTAPSARPRALPLSSMPRAHLWIPQIAYIFCAPSTTHTACDACTCVISLLTWPACPTLLNHRWWDYSTPPPPFQPHPQ